MIDTSGWKEFRIGDLFNVVLSKGDIKADAVDEGNVPLISSGQSNNGLVAYVDEKGDGKASMFCGNTITVDMFCNAFYQPNDYYAVSHGRINVLLPKFNLTPNIALFICTIINKEIYKYSYGRAVYSNEIQKMIIKLPATPFGEPDWQYMEDFMGGAALRPITTSVKSSHLPLETEKWGEFRVGDLFDVTIAKSSDFGNTDEGKIRFVGRTNENNGVQGFVDVPFEKIVDADCISVSMVGTNVALWQDEEFAASQNIAVLRNKNVNVYSGLFVCSVLNMDMRYKYSYGRTVSKEKLSDTTLLLPVQIDGTPDWQWMEDYMKSLPFSDKINLKEKIIK